MKVSIVLIKKKTRLIMKQNFTNFSLACFFLMQ